MGGAVDAAVAVQGLRKRYRHVVAVDDLSFSAGFGAVTAVLGPNGAGKTTTLEICEGLRRADGGTVRVLGLMPGERALRARVGVMPQRLGAYPGARCAEMLALMASYYAAPLPTGELLDRLGLTSVAGVPARRLSGGQQQRLSLAMAVVGRPEVAFLDEPTAGLDVQARQATWDLVRELRSSAVAVVLTTHAMEEAAALADQVVIIDHGRVLAAGDVATLTGDGGDGAGTERQLRFRAPAGLPLDGLRAALPAGARAVESPAGAYLIETSVTPQVVASVTAWAAALGVLARDLQVGGRTLEDVFVELTGRELRA